MNKYLIKSLISLMAAVCCLCCGCTRNNGDIGPKFGTWKLTSMTIDGEPAPEYQGNIFWGFQSGSLSFTTVTYTNGIPSDVNTPGHLVFAGWSEADGYLVINTAFSDDQGTYRYTPPAVLLLPEQNPAIRLKILSEDSRRMELEYITDAGNRMTYSLRKWS